MGNKLPKRILRMKGLTMKQKWAMHKRGSKGTKSKGGSVKKATKWVKKQWGLGRIIAGGRIADILSRPLQRAYLHHPDAVGKVAATYYSAGMSDGTYDKKLAKSVYGEMGTGVGVTFLKSKAGVYRGAGKGKILSIVQALSPEILAYTEYDPLTETKQYNAVRRGYDSGGGMDMRGWTLDHTKGYGERFWKDKGFNVLLGLVQKGVFNTNGPIGLNRYLPKGFNF